MSDLISRQAAIIALEKRTGIDWKSLKILVPMLVVLEELPSVQPELRWIPVEEKLPEVGESVLVTFSLIEKYSCVKIARYGTPIHDEYNICFYESDNEWGDCEISGVTAWMPLPKPYERIEE